MEPYVRKWVNTSMLRVVYICVMAMQLFKIHNIIYYSRNSNISWKMMYPILLSLLFQWIDLIREKLVFIVVGLATHALSLIILWLFWLPYWNYGNLYTRTVAISEKKSSENPHKLPLGDFLNSLGFFGIPLWKIIELFTMEFPFYLM